MRLARNDIGCMPCASVRMNGARGVSRPRGKTSMSIGKVEKDGERTETREIATDRFHRALTSREKLTSTARSCLTIKRLIYLRAELSVVLVVFLLPSDR